MRHRATGARPWPLNLEAARWSTKHLSASTVRLVLSGRYVTVRASTRPENSPARGRGAVGCAGTRTRRPPAGPRVRQSDSRSPHRAACQCARSMLGPGAAPSGRRRWGWRLWSDAPRRQGCPLAAPPRRPRGASCQWPAHCAPQAASQPERRTRPRQPPSRQLGSPDGPASAWPQRGRRGCQCPTAPGPREPSHMGRRAPGCF
jgi:hypothetical protein